MLNSADILSKKTNSILNGFGRKLGSVGSPPGSPSSPGSPRRSSSVSASVRSSLRGFNSPRSMSPLEQFYSKDKGFDVTACFIACCLVALGVISVVMLLATSLFSWSQSDLLDRTTYHAPVSNWCPGGVERRLSPDELELRLNHSLTNAFLQNQIYSVINYIHLELKWSLKPDDMSSKPFVAFVVPGTDSNFACLIDIDTKQFKTLKLDPDHPSDFIKQLKERHPKLRPDHTLSLSSSTPFRMAIFVTVSVRSRSVTLDLFDHFSAVNYNRTLISDVYNFERTGRPEPLMNPVFYVVSGIVNNETISTKLEISSKQFGCNVYRANNDHNVTAEEVKIDKQLCRSNDSGGFYSCSEKDTETVST